MFITQCKFSDAGEEPFWHDLNERHNIQDARKDLKECKNLYKKNKTYKWRIIKRIIVYKRIEKTVK